MAKKSKEVERKWLVEDLPDLSRHKRESIRQGYVSVSPESEVRLRQRGKRFFETIKTGTELKRGEIEAELSRKQFLSLWPATLGRRLEKVRYTLKLPSRKIELDVYKQKLAGLKTAEVEFTSRKEANAFEPLEWFGKEVTADKEYRNANLANGKRKFIA
jgi:CYTH domain-containing protein